MPELTKEEEQKAWEDGAKAAQEAVKQGDMTQEQADKWEGAAAQGRSSDKKLTAWWLVLASLYGFVQGFRKSLNHEW
ncbi:hypothetical protein ASPCAL07515 [Aspergillus calidoustus]|uniref:Uncharacterized protein n=1 Tax=Aspergillus calidoustus TaxID=454130 RepID=A0A0U5CAU8_ASPCI|nr:hypothetical protein ASPCAL07515 [Aspergillus calidoustus]